MKNKVKINDIVVTKNEVGLSSMNLSINEEKLLLVCMAYFHKVTYFKRDDEFLDKDGYMTIYALDFGCIMLGYDVSGELNSQQIREAEKLGRTTLSRLGDEKNDNILKKIMRVKELDAKGEVGIKRYTIINGIFYVKDSQYIKVRFAPEIYDFFKHNDGNFNSFVLKSIGRNNTNYANKLYRYLNSNIFKSKYGEKIETLLEINNLKFILAIDEGKYFSPQNIKDKVLRPSIESINTYTNIEVDFEPIIKSNKTWGFKFIYGYNSEYKINNRIKEILNEEKIQASKNNLYFRDGSHFDMPEYKFNPPKSISEKQAGLLISIDEFVEYYANVLNLVGKTDIECRKILKAKMLGDYNCFEKHPINFDKWVWIKNNKEAGITDEILKARFADTDIAGSSTIHVPEDGEGYQNELQFG